MPDKFESHITASDKCNAIDLLASHVALSRQQLKRAMMLGAVWLQNNYGTERIRRAKKRLQPGDTLHLYYDEAVLMQTPPAARLISDEDEYSIWDKPCGMFSQGSKWGDHCTLYRWAENQLQRPAFTVHRLDRAASGLMIVAHSRKTATAFLEIFQQRAIEKHYRASVQGDLSGLALPFVISETIDDKSAHSVILQAEHDDTSDTSTVIIDIHSGRKHQIRRHLSSIGHPIVGDRLYGAGDSDSDLQLRALMLKFACPNDGLVKMWTLDGYTPST